MIHRIALVLLFSLWATLAHATAFYPNSGWFWIVGDTNPTTQVWKGDAGAMETNSSADYQSFVGSLTQAQAGLVGNTPFMVITATADNGAGLIRVTGNSTLNMTTGDALVVNGTSTVADGTWTISVIDSNCNNGTCRVDLVGSSFSGSPATTGVLGGGTKIATQAGLNAFINQYNVGLWSSGTFSGVNNIGGITVDKTLTNPTSGQCTGTPGTALCQQIIIQNNAGVPKKLILPKANLFGSFPMGTPILFVNTGGRISADLTLTAQDGSTSVLGAILPHVSSTLVELSDNSTQNGSWTGQFLIGSTGGPPLVMNSGGTGTGTIANSAQIGVGNGSLQYIPQTMSGDCTNNASLNITCTKLNGVTLTIPAAPWNATAPTIASGFCATSPSISASNGTAAFDINVGTSCTGMQTGTLTMPTAPTGWTCNFQDVTTPASYVISQTGGNTTSVTLTSYGRTTGLATDMTASDHIRGACTAY